MKAIINNLAGPLASSQNFAIKKKMPKGTSKLMRPQPVLCLNPFTISIIPLTKRRIEKTRDKIAIII
jgi:hypothetical protein